MVTQAQKARLNIKKKRRALVVEETKLARLKKRARSVEAHGKFLLGNMTIMAGWGKLQHADAEKRIKQLCTLMKTDDLYSEYKKLGEELFKISTQTESELSDLDKKSRDSEIHYRITIGGEIIKQGLGMESRAILLGAMSELKDSKFE